VSGDLERTAGRDSMGGRTEGERVTDAYSDAQARRPPPSSLFGWPLLLLLLPPLPPPHSSPSLCSCTCFLRRVPCRLRRWSSAACSSSSVEDSSDDDSSKGRGLW
jgi:hypothetical protein